MGLLDFMAAGSGQTAPAGLLSPAQPVSGLLSPGAGGAEAQKWANALAALAAARQRQTQNAADPASYVNLLAGLARLAGAARPVNVPAVPLPSAAPPAAALLQNAPAGCRSQRRRKSRIQFQAPKPCRRKIPAGPSRRCADAGLSCDIAGWLGLRRDRPRRRE